MEGVQYPQGKGGRGEASEGQMNCGNCCTFQVVPKVKIGGEVLNWFSVM